MYLSNLSIFGDIIKSYSLIDFTKFLFEFLGLRKSSKFQFIQTVLLLINFKTIG